MPITPAAKGMEVSKPTLSTLLTPVALIIVGSQNVTPYIPIKRQKYMKLISHTMPLPKASRRECLCFACDSASIFFSRTCFSSSDNQVALGILSSRYKYTTMPMTTDGSPSNKNNHCHPAQPKLPASDCIIHPEAGPPMTPETGFAAMSKATILPRQYEGYQ